MSSVCLSLTSISLTISGQHWPYPAILAQCLNCKWRFSFLLAFSLPGCACSSMIDCQVLIIVVLEFF